jgi:hypothetical protein
MRVSSLMMRGRFFAGLAAKATSSLGRAFVLSDRLRRSRERLLLAGTTSSAWYHTVDIEGGLRRSDGRRGRRRLLQISVCSEISRASSTSMPRYLTVDSSLECPRSNCTARRFLVRR